MCDLYQIYDRIMDGVVIPVIFEIDENSIIKNGVTKDNVKFIKSEAVHDAFLSSSPFDLKKIEKDIKNYYDDEQVLEEELAESLNDNDYYRLFPQ